MEGRIAVMLLAAVGCGRIGFGDEAGQADQDATARTYLFQDGFEDTLSPWMPLGNVVVDSGPPLAMEGTSTLKAQGNTATSARAQVMLPRNVMSGAFFVRGYFYLPSGYPITDLSLVEIVQAQTDNLIVMSVPELAVLSQIDTSGRASTFVLPRDVWLCIETRVGIADAPNGTIDIWVDGVLRLSTTSSDTLSTGIDELHIGVTWAGPAQAPAVVYVDDVIADNTGLIGCR